MLRPGAVPRPSGPPHPTVRRAAQALRGLPGNQLAATCLTLCPGRAPGQPAWYGLCLRRPPAAGCRVADRPHLNRMFGAVTRPSHQRRTARSLRYEIRSAQDTGHGRQCSCLRASEPVGGPEAPGGGGALRRAPPVGRVPHGPPTGRPTRRQGGARPAPPTSTNAHRSLAPPLGERGGAGRQGGAGPVRGISGSGGHRQSSGVRLGGAVDAHRGHGGERAARQARPERDVVEGPRAGGSPNSTS